MDGPAQGEKKWFEPTQLEHATTEKVVPMAGVASSGSMKRVDDSAAASEKNVKRAKQAALADNIFGPLDTAYE